MVLKILLVMFLAGGNFRLAEGVGESSTLLYSKGDLTILDGPNSHEDDFVNSGLVFPRRQQRSITPQIPNPRLKGDFADLPIELLAEESRRNNGGRRHSYNHRSKPKKTHYSTHNQHSDGGKNGKGGYHNTKSYKGNSGYSTNSDYNKANRDSYADQDHKQYGQRHGDNYGDSTSGGRSYGGGGLYANEYGDDGRSYTRAEEY